MGIGELAAWCRLQCHPLAQKAEADMRSCARDIHLQNAI
jgi:hypothetical protein